MRVAHKTGAEQSSTKETSRGAALGLSRAAQQKTLKRVHDGRQDMSHKGDFERRRMRDVESGCTMGVETSCPKGVETRCTKEVVTRCLRNIETRCLNMTGIEAHRMKVVQ